MTHLSNEGGAGRDIIADMEALGFARVPNGGGTEAMVKHINGRTIVATGLDGDLPADDWFCACLYEGDWIVNAHAREVEGFTSEEPGALVSAAGLPPIDEALRRLEERAAVVTNGDRVFAFLNGDGAKPDAETVRAVIAEEERAPSPCPDFLGALRRLIAEREGH